MRLHKRRYLFHGYMIAGLQRSLSRVEHLAYVGIFHFVLVAQVEQHTLNLWQSGDGFLQQSLCHVAVEIVISH